MRRQLRLAKVSRSTAGYRWVGTATDDAVDLRRTRMDLSLFQDFCDNTAEYGMPFLSVAHYKDGKVGIADNIWIDGHNLKLAGTFGDDEMANATIQSLLEDRSRPSPKIQQSIGFYPRAISWEDEVMAYTRGWLEHSALTVVPVNPRSDVRIVLQGAVMTRYDDAAAIVGPELAKRLELADRERRAQLRARSLVVPDLPLGSKLDALLEVLCAQVCVGVPIVVFSATAPEPPSPTSPRPFLVDPDFEAWLRGTVGEVDLSSPPVLALLRSLAGRAIPRDVTLSDGDVLELYASRPSYAYLAKLADVLRGAVDESTWAQAHKVARGHAGGKAYPYDPTRVEVDDFDVDEPTRKPSEVAGSERVGKLVRAFLGVYKRNQAPDVPEHERVGNVVVALEDLKRSLIPLLKRSDAVELSEAVEQVLGDLASLSDEALREVHQSIHRSYLLAKLASTTEYAITV
jgi:hypothetical protein